MSVYSFKVTVGKYQLSVSTTDKEMITNQFALWVKQASEYVRQQRAKAGINRVNSQIKAENELTQKKIDEQLSKFPNPEPIEETPVVAKKETFADNKDDANKNIDVFYSQLPEKKTDEPADFDSILDKSLNLNTSTELSFKPNPTIKKDNAFLNYIGDRKLEKKMDYLLLTAYYFTQYEQKPRFTIKQLNAKLMQNVAVILDHSIIQEAINRGYVECLPDLTGVVGASEYRLTAYGEKVLLDE